MRNSTSAAGAIALAAATAILVSAPIDSGRAAPVGTPAATHSQLTAGTDIGVELVQYRRGYGGPARGYVAPRGYYAPRPGFYGGPRYYGGGRAWAYRPWYRRPYYGTIIGGVALGAIIGAAAYGMAPPPPRPDLCWYWADEGQTSGYWDYC